MAVQKRFNLIAKCFDKKGNLLSVGVNSYVKSSPVMKHFAKLAGEPYKIYLHAEVQALLRARDKIVHRITVERYDEEGNMRLAKPCPICTLAIKEFGVKYVEYTSPEGIIKEKVQ